MFLSAFAVLRRDRSEQIGAPADAGTKKFELSNDLEKTYWFRVSGDTRPLGRCVETSTEFICSVVRYGCEGI